MTAVQQNPSDLVVVGVVDAKDMTDIFRTLRGVPAIYPFMVVVEKEKVADVAGGSELGTGPWSFFSFSFRMAFSHFFMAFGPT